MNERNIFFLSEAKHVEATTSFLSAHPDIAREGYLIIPLDAEVEYALTKKGVPFQSGRNYRTGDAEPMVLGEQWTESMFKSERWSFFRYRGIELSRVYFFSLQVYLTSLLYYADIVANIFAQHPSVVRCIVFPPLNEAPPLGFSLEGHRMKALVDVATLFSSERDIEIRVVEGTASMRARTGAVSFAGKRILFGWGIGLLNAAVSLVRRPRRLRILASDYWSNLAPYLKNLDSAEVLLLDRMQLFKARPSNIWKYRMRFVHLDAYPRGVSQEGMRTREQIAEEWQSLRKDSELPEFLFHNLSLRSLVVKALDTIIADVTTRTLKDIDDAYELLARVKPDIVELRSTMSTQTHFVILAQVARVLGIPSLEMQHGLEYYGPGSMDRRHSAEHMGVYGPLTRRELRAAGDDITTHIIGSPRFDVYAPLGKEYRTELKAPRAGISVLCIVPTIVVGVATDSYDVETYLVRVAREAQKVPQASVVIKLRPGYLRQSFYEAVVARAFAGVSYRIAQFESLAELYPQADIVISPYSTSLLEALQCGKPVIYLGLSAGYALMGKHHLTEYAKQNALALATTPEEFGTAFHMLIERPEARSQMSRAATTFLEKEYAFDGNASKRAAALITSLASNGHKQGLS